MIKNLEKRHDFLQSSLQWLMMINLQNHFCLVRISIDRFNCIYLTLSEPFEVSEKQRSRNMLRINHFFIVILTAIMATVPAAQGSQHGTPANPGYHAPPAWPTYRTDPWAGGMRNMEREIRRQQWEMERRMRRMERNFDHEWRRDGSQIEIQESFSSPKIRIDEDVENYIVTATIPGADEKTIEVEQRGNRLRIAAMRQVEKRQTSDGRRMQSSFSSRFQRILTLPGPVKESGMKTEHGNDVLTIRIPKAD